MRHLLRLLPLLLGPLSGQVTAQYTTVPFTSGPIPLCDTSTFTANVSGIGTLYPPGWNNWTYSLDQLLINVTSDHPQTLVITLTSPEGTELLLSAYNGAGGQNYTNTVFTYSDWNTPITSGSAPFSGWWTAQGGGLDLFDYENADGTWTITIVDTACANGGGGGGGGGGNPWTPGWFDGSTGGGGFGFAFSGPPPCWDPWAVQPGSAYLCPGESVDILGYYQNTNWAYTYTVSNWSGITFDPNAVTEPGYYWVDAYDPWTGCFYGAEFQVFASTPVVLGPDQVVTLCPGAPPMDLYSLFDVSNADQVAWSFNGSAITWTMAQNASAPGIYQLIADNYGGCGDTALVTITQGAAGLLGPDQTLSACAGAPADMTVLFDLTGLSAAWSVGGLPYITPEAALDPAVYTLVATNADGCSDTATVTLTVEPQPALGADQALAVCANATLDLTALYTTTGLSAAWTLAGVPVADPAAIALAGTYQLVAGSGAGCADTALVTVSLLANPALGADAADVFCSSATVDLGGFYNTNGLNGAWTLAGAPVADPAQVNTAGTYTLIAADANGCTDTAQVTLTQSQDPVLGADQAVQACSNAPVDLTALYNTGANTATWTMGGNAVAQPAAVDQSGLYTLTATNADGCSSTATVTVTVSAAPVLGGDQSAAICAGTTFDLTGLYATGGLSPVWTRNGAVVNNPAAAGTAGTYQLVVTDANGCHDTAVVALAVNASPDLGTDLFFQLCPWQTVDLGAVFPVAGLSASYAANGQPMSDPGAVHDAGLYTVAVIDGNGCADTALAQVINVDCLCEADITTDARCYQDPAQFMVSADSIVLDVHWDFGDAAGATTEMDPLVLFRQEGEVLVTMEATLTCGVVRVERLIELQDCADSCSVFIPNAFTPDGDGLNEAWRWHGGCWPEEFIMRVFNRQGELVFSTTDPLRTWDGTYGGVPAPSGVYVFKGGFRLPYQDRQEVKGAVTLVR